MPDALVAGADKESEAVKIQKPNMWRMFSK
jgi:hypothetical protein